MTSIPIAQIIRHFFPSRKSCLTVALTCSVIFALSPVSAWAQPSNLYVTNLATNAIDVYTLDGAKSVLATGLNSPQGLAFDRDHNLYVADAGSGSIFKYDEVGNRTTFYSGLSAPVGLAIDGNTLLLAESGLDRVMILTLDQSEEPRIYFSRENPILGVAISDDTRWVTYSNTLNYESFNVGGFIDFDASTQGVTVVPRRVGPVGVETYVTTAAGDIWVVKQPRTGQHWNWFIFASGLTDPNGMAFLPGRGRDGDAGELYVADRGVGTIFKYTRAGVQSVFVSDAGMPNFLAFDAN